MTAALSLVELDGFADRSPAMLSGGQRQRVALARCMVTEPSLVLLDEPLANLDVHLHASMEREFSRFHERTGTTMIYITHDQAEAMALADRIAVMDKGGCCRSRRRTNSIASLPTRWSRASSRGHGRAVENSPRRGRCNLRGGPLRIRVRMRRARTQRPETHKPAPACAPARCRIVAPDAPGVRACVDSAIYRGGHFRVEAHIEASPGLLLQLTLPEPCVVEPGAAINVAVDDGWVIPKPAKD